MLRTTTCTSLLRAGSTGVLRLLVSSSVPIAAGIAIILACAGTTAAQTSIEFDFDTDGESPTLHPDIEYSPFTAGVPESEIFTIVGGVLEQRTFSINGSAFYYGGEPGAGIPPTPLSLVPHLDTTLEARLKILQINGTGGAVLQAIDTANRYTCSFDGNGVTISTTGGNVHIKVNVFEYHTYRLESPAHCNRLSVYIDDVLVLTTNAAALALNEFAWTDGHSAPGNGADADWDFIRLVQSEPVPCPADVAGCAGTVDVEDLLAVLGAWGPCNECPQDIDMSGAVDVSDVLAVIGAWGDCR